MGCKKWSLFLLIASPVTPALSNAYLREVNAGSEFQNIASVELGAIVTTFLLGASSLFFIERQLYSKFASSPITQNRNLCFCEIPSLELELDLSFPDEASNSDLSSKERIPSKGFPAKINLEGIWSENALLSIRVTHPIRHIAHHQKGHSQLQGFCNREKNRAWSWVYTYLSGCFAIGILLIFSISWILDAIVCHRMKLFYQIAVILNEHGRVCNGILRTE